MNLKNTWSIHKSALFQITSQMTQLEIAAKSAYFSASLVILATSLPPALSKRRPTSTWESAVCYDIAETGSVSAASLHHFSPTATVNLRKNATTTSSNMYYIAKISIVGPWWLKNMFSIIFYMFVTHVGPKKACANIQPPPPWWRSRGSVDSPLWSPNVCPWHWQRLSALYRQCTAKNPGLSRSNKI